MKYSGFASSICPGFTLKLFVLGPVEGTRGRDQKEEGVEGRVEGIVREGRFGRVEGIVDLPSQSS